VGILKGEQDNFYIDNGRLAEIFSAEFGDGVVVVSLLFKLLLAKAEEEVAIKSFEEKLEGSSEVDKLFVKERLEDRRNLKDIADAVRLLLDSIDLYDEDIAGMLCRKLFELEARGLITLTERVFATMVKVTGFTPFVKDERRLKGSERP